MDATVRILPDEPIPDPYRTAQAVVADRLRRAILSGQLAPGARLLQAQVADEMRTSSTPVREAIRELAGEGLLDLDPHRGVVVHRPDIEELDEVYRIRKLLEPVAIAATVKRITDAQLKMAEDLLDRMDDAPDVTEWAILNARFHGLLAEASRMPILRSHLVKLRNLSTLYIASQIHRHPDRVVQANAEHRAILEACQARDVRRAQEVEVAHLEHTLAIGAERLRQRPGRASRSRAAP